MKSAGAPSPGVAFSLPSALPMPTAVAEEILLRPSGTEVSLWQQTEEDLNFVLNHGLYLSLDMIQDIKEILVLFVFHLISF